MQSRQIIAVLVAAIVILGVGLFVVTWDRDADRATTDTTTTTTTTTTTVDTAPTTTTAPQTTTTTTTTTIPVDCGLKPAATATDAAEQGGSTDESEESEAEPAGDSEPLITPTIGPNSSVTTIGLDKVTFGLTVPKAERAAGTQMIPCSPVDECYRVVPSTAPDGISFVVTKGTIERVDITSGPITTRSGIGIGTKEGRIIELFGKRIERKIINDSSLELVFVPVDKDDAQFRVIFTIRDGAVASFRSGRIPQVLAADPCATA